MDLFSRLEHALEGLVEGVFSRAFRAPLQPIEIAKRLMREMENHRAVSVTATYVPNSYTVLLAPDTLAGFAPICPRLLSELEQYLREYAAEHRYDTIGSIAVRLQEDAGVKSGELQVSVANDAAAVPSTPAPSPALRAEVQAAPVRRTPTFTGEQERTSLLTSAEIGVLEVIAGEGIGRNITLTDGLKIGRGPANDIALTEPGISRHHAEIVRADESWLLRDQGSTNGTFVNGRQITTHRLQPGDTVRVGGTVLKVR